MSVAAKLHKQKSWGMNRNQAHRFLGIDRGTLAVGAPADVTIFDPNCEWALDAASLASKSKNTPFDRWSMKGKVMRTIVGGRSMWGEER